TSSTVVTITLDSSGVPVNHYIAGNTYNITIKGVNTSSSSYPAFGFTLTAVKAAGAGTTSATNAGTLASSGLPSGCVNRTLGSLNLIEHSTSLGYSSGSGGSGTVYTRSISWTAPATGSGTVILFGVLNAINNNSASSGDAWNFATDTLQEFFPSVLPITGPTAVCAGSTVTLSSGTTGGTWSSSNTSIATISSTGVVTGLSGGNVIITYNVGGTMGYDTSMMYVSPLPYAGFIHGGTKICTNDTFTLRSTVTGGTWSSTNPAIVSVNTTTGKIYAGSSTGIATIIYSSSNMCGSSYAYNPDTVVTAPATGTISGPSFCEGFSAQLYRTTGTGGGSWSTSSTSIASVSAT
ncbi:MAG: hypothetical protein EBZ77_17740, partial [Chitinophagia bacterium]|nr:hypothetical protein [Chitinophagia bacterium]